MFSQKFNEVRERIRHELRGRNPVELYLLYHSTRIWCEELEINKDIADFILRGYCQPEIKDLTTYIYQAGTIEKENWLLPTRDRFYQYINALFNRMNIRRENMEFIVLIAFAITAIGYWIYILNQQKQQQTTRGEEPRQDNPNPLPPTVYKVQTPSTPTPPIPKTTNQFLILVVSHSQADFLESLVAKSDINSNDGESLYEITKYLWLGSESEFSQTTANIKQYSVSKGAESEYDIYLVYVELKEADEGFTSNVNQLDRYDAFRKLDDLALNLRISPRLQMEAYGNIKVYNR